MDRDKKKLIPERQIIAEISRRLEAVKPDTLIQGIGDDCAVCRLSEGRVSLLTVDTLVEGIHFDRRWHPAHLLGRKAASVNISDIAAMGGTPQFALLSLGISPRCGQEWIDSFLSGFKTVLEEYALYLIGGDTVHSGERFMVSVTVTGEMAEKDVCYRSGARTGDLVWVSGYLGEAAAGLELCRKGFNDLPRYRSLIDAHLNPEPKLDLGRCLAKSGLVHAMMDISDGLATDLAHICAASSVGAEIEASAIPLSDALLGAAEKLEYPSLDFALKGGEDYQLVFTASPENRDQLLSLGNKAGQKISCVGKIVPGKGVFLCRGGEKQDIGYRGYEHIF